MLEKEHRKHNSFTKYCNKFFLIKQEMNIYKKLLEKEHKNAILILLLQPYQQVESCWEKNKQNTIHIAEYFKKL